LEVKVSSITQEITIIWSFLLLCEVVVTVIFEGEVVELLDDDADGGDGEVVRDGDSERGIAMA